MSIRKQADGTYLVEAYIGGSRTRRVAGTLKDAKRIEQEIRTAPVGTHRGLAEALHRHLTGGAKALKDYTNVLSSAKVLEPFIVGKTLRDAGQVADDIKRALTGKFTNSTINRKLALLRHICHLGFEWGWDDVPHWIRVKLLPENPQRHVYLTMDQVEVIAALCPRSGSIVRLAAYTGLRKGELLGLARTNIQGSVIVLDAHTKSGRPRAVPVPPAAVSLLADIPFTCTIAVLRAEFQAARVEVGMPALRFHDLRHSYASMLVQQGVPMKLVGALLGHSSTAMTDRYTHLAPKHLVAAVDLAFTATPTAAKNVSPWFDRDNLGTT